MSITVSQLVGLVTIQGVDQGVAGLARMGVAADLTGKQLALLGAGAVVVAGAAFVAFALKTASMAGDFQVQMTKLYTTAGESLGNLKMVGNGILNMAVPTATSVRALGDAMYWIESSGLHGQKGLDALRIAAMGAKAEGANLNDVAKALGASINAYSGYGMTNAQVMNTLIAATGQGMMTMQQLATSLSNVLPASAKFHISLKDVTAALATMTAQGDPAAQAATHLKQMILALEAPSKIGAKALASVGLTSQEVATQMTKSLPDAVKMITDAVGKKFPEGSAAYNQAIKDIAGGNKQMMGFLELSGVHLSTFADNVKKIGGAVKAGGDQIMGWGQVQQNFNFKVDQMKAGLEAFGIRIGQFFLPILSRLIDWLMTQVVPALQRFGDWFMKNGVPALQAFGGWIAANLFPILQQIGTIVQQNVLPMLQRFGQWFMTDAVPALKQFGQIIQTNVFPVIKDLVSIIGIALGWLKDHWTQIWALLGPIVKGTFDSIAGSIKIAWSIISGIIKIALDILRGNWGQAWTDLKNMLSGVWDGIVLVFKGRLETIGGIVKGALQLLGNAFSGFGTLMHGIWDGIVGIIKGAINGIIGLINGFIGFIDSIQIHIPSIGVGPLSTPAFDWGGLGIPTIPYLEKGGPVFQTGLAMVHKGEYVIPAGGFPSSRMPSSYGSGTGGMTQVNLQINGYTMARLLMPSIVANIRNNVGVTNL